MIYCHCSTSCGSVNLFSGKNPMFRNNIVLHLGPSSSLERAELVVPFSCRFKPGLPGMEAEAEAASQGDGGNAALDDFSFDSVGDQEEEEEEMYVMIVTVFHLDGRPSSVLSRRGDAAVASVGEEARVSVSFDTRASLRLALEKCWLTAYEDGGYYDADSGDRLLVKEGCPVLSDDGGANVTLLPNGGGGGEGGPLDPSFSFRLTPLARPAKRVYLMCLMGLCSPEQSASGLNVGQVR